MALAMRRTMFGRISMGLRQREKHVERLSTTDGRKALQHFINDNVLHIATVDYTKSMPATIAASYPTPRTIWGFVYYDRVEWLIPFDRFAEHCKRKLKIEHAAALEDALQSGAIIPGADGSPTQTRPIPSALGVEGEFIVYVVNLPTLETYK